MYVRQARYTLPLFLRGKTGTLYTSFAPAGDPPSQSSGTLMSLQEGVAAPLGKAPCPPQTEPPQCLQPNLYPRRAVCGTLPQHSPSRLRAHSSQAEHPGCIPLRATHTIPRTTGRGMELVGERSVCSVATSGCPKRSEDGFPVGARNIPPRPVQPSPTTTSNPNKKPRDEVRGFESG